MTLIVAPADFASKAKLADALNTGNCMIHNPSIMGTWTKPSRDFAPGFSEVVTNHPLRTKFAKITRTVGGWKVS